MWRVPVQVRARWRKAWWQSGRGSHNRQGSWSFEAIEKKLPIGKVQRYRAPKLKTNFTKKIFKNYPHVLRCEYWLKANKRNLHRQNCSNSVNLDKVIITLKKPRNYRCVRNVMLVIKTTSDHQSQNMKWNQIDKKYVASPRRNHVEIR